LRVEQGEKRKRLHHTTNLYFSTFTLYNNWNSETARTSREKKHENKQKHFKAKLNSIFANSINACSVQVLLFHIEQLKEKGTKTNYQLHTKINKYINKNSGDHQKEKENKQRNKNNQYDILDTNLSGNT
jgi:hypothetical protein